MICRRDLLLLVLSGGAVAVAAGAVYQRFSAASPDSLDAVLHSLQASDALGKAWLASLAEPPNKSSLMAALEARIDGQAVDIASEIARLIREDFAQNRLCELEGWQLSLTECQLAGLRYLLVGPAVADASEPMSDVGLGSDGFLEGVIAPLEDWGPKRTLEQLKFNVQSDGHSGIWFKIQGAPAHARIEIDGMSMPTVVTDTLITSGLFGRLQARMLATPGEYTIALIDPVRKIRQVLGVFSVAADPRQAKARGEVESIFCEVTDWGPQQTEAGVAANEQPDGSMGVWMRTDCFPEGADLLLEGDRLPTTRTEFGLTAKIPPALLGSPGAKELYFLDEETGERQQVGYIQVI